MKSSTEVLRALLDERGVEWWEDAFASEHRTVFDGKNDVRYCVYQLGFELFISSILPVTPEQAIAATLGAGTCRMELPDLRGPAFTDVYICSECGGEVMVGTVMGESDVPKWCPWCGRKVVGA